MNIKQLKENLNKIIRLEYKTKSEAEEILKSLDMENFEQEFDFFRQALLLDLKGEYEKNVQLLSTTLELAYAKNNKYIVVECQMLLAYYQLSKQNYENAFQLYLQVLNHGDNIRAINNIGVIYCILKNFDKAQIYFEQALELFSNSKENRSKKMEMLLYGNIAECLFFYEKYDEVIEITDRSLTYSKQSKNYFSMSQSYELMSKIKINGKDYKSAREYLLKARDCLLKCSLNNTKMISHDLDNLLRLEARIYFESSDYKKSINVLNNICKTIKEDYELLINNYECLDDFKEAYENHKKYLEYVKEEESIHLVMKNDNLLSKTKMYESEKRLNEFELLYKNTRSISEIGKDIIASTDLHDSAKIIYNKISSIMNITTLLIGKVDASGIINFDWCIENNENFTAFTASINESKSFSAWVVNNKKAIRIIDATDPKEVTKYVDEVRDHQGGVAIESVIVCPVMIGDDVLGVISVQTVGKYQYNEYDLEVISMFASFIAVVIKKWDDEKLLTDANEKLMLLSKTDALTGISNRHYLSETVETIFKQTTTNEDVLSVVMIDIDHFKEFNDTYGHIEGDRCIVQVVNQLKVLLDFNESKLFRFGGDEFVAIIPNKSIENVFKVLEETRLSVESLRISNKNSVVSEFVTCSFGFTTVVKSAEMEYQRAFYLADKALYVSKANGKNQIAFEENSFDL